jgi:hypothetical protein
MPRRRGTTKPWFQRGGTPAPTRPPNRVAISWLTGIKPEARGTPRLDFALEAL